MNIVRQLCQEVSEITGVALTEADVQNAIVEVAHRRPDALISLREVREALRDLQTKADWAAQKAADACRQVERDRFYWGSFGVGMALTACEKLPRYPLPKPAIMPGQMLKVPNDWKPGDKLVSWEKVERWMLRFVGGERTGWLKKHLGID